MAGLVAWGATVLACHAWEDGAPLLKDDTPYGAAPPYDDAPMIRGDTSRLEAVWMGVASSPRARLPTHESAWDRLMEAYCHGHLGAEKPRQPPQPPEEEVHQTRYCSDPAGLDEEHKVAGAGDRQTLETAYDCRELDAYLPEGC